MKKTYQILHHVLKQLEHTETQSLLDLLHTELERIYTLKGYSSLRHAILYFLYTLLSRPRPIGHSQRWEKENLARDIARMPCMKHFFLHGHEWRSLLERALDVAADGEIRLASEQDFLDELQAELLVQKKLFYKNAADKCAVYKEDLLAAVMHPDRIEKLINKYGIEELDNLFGY